mmetsp:Transcript_16058/g.60740  ORF Transcript_16058/g.60740 Transcript_16058/m.60740 type:complete len:204 (-) Transcript_16058:165-776(-)
MARTSLAIERARSRNRLAALAPVMARTATNAAKAMSPATRSAVLPPKPPASAASTTAMALVDKVMNPEATHTAVTCHFSGGRPPDAAVISRHTRITKQYALSHADWGRRSKRPSTARAPMVHVEETFVSHSKRSRLPPVLSHAAVSRAPHAGQSALVRSHRQTRRHSAISTQTMCTAAVMTTMAVQGAVPDSCTKSTWHLSPR